MVRTITNFCMFVSLGTALLLSGCGSDSSTPPANPTGYLVGSLIENMPYTCGSTSGKTGRIGQFSYQAGDSCTFTLGKNSFSVGPDKLQKGYISAYDLTATQQEAWTLMALIDSISHRRPNSDLILIIDNNLERRIPLVDLSKGDAAVTGALATFKGTVVAVSMEAARQRLRKTLYEDNTLAITREQLVAQGKQLLDSLRLNLVSGEKWEELQVTASATAKKSMTNHDNRVNLRFYDYEGNPLSLSSSDSDSHYTAGNADQYLWVTSGQNPDNSIPHLGLNNGDITGSNILGIDLYVGRKDSTDVADSFRNYAQWLGTGQFGGSPVSVFAHGAKNDQQTSNGFPQQLNFGYMIGMYSAAMQVGAGVPPSKYSTQVLPPAIYATGFYCPDVMFGQGSTKASWTQWLNSLRSLGDVISDTAEVVSEEGSSIVADAKVFKSFAEFVKSAADLATQNWWVMTTATHTPNARITLNGNDGVLTRCYPTYTSGFLGSLQYSIDYTSPMPAVFTSTHDDHTFDVRLAFPWQKLQGVTLSN